MSPLKVTGAPASVGLDAVSVLLLQATRIAIMAIIAMTFSLYISIDLL
jgi:hypothetical protein